MQTEGQARGNSASHLDQHSTETHTQTLAATLLPDAQSKAEMCGKPEQAKEGRRAEPAVPTSVISSLGLLGRQAVGHMDLRPFPAPPHGDLVVLNQSFQPRL